MGGILASFPSFKAPENESEEGTSLWMKPYEEEQHTTTTWYYEAKSDFQNNETKIG